MKSCPSVLAGTLDSKNPDYCISDQFNYVSDKKNLKNILDKSLIS